MNKVEFKYRRTWASSVFKYRGTWASGEFTVEECWDPVNLNILKRASGEYKYQGTCVLGNIGTCFTGGKT